MAGSATINTRYIITASTPTIASITVQVSWSSINNTRTSLLSAEHDGDTTRYTHCAPRLLNMAYDTANPSQYVASSQIRGNEWFSIFFFFCLPVMPKGNENHQSRGVTRSVYQPYPSPRQQLKQHCPLPPLGLPLSFRRPTRQHTRQRIPRSNRSRRGNEAERRHPPRPPPPPPPPPSPPEPTPTSTVLGKSRGSSRRNGRGRSRSRDQGRKEVVTRLS